MTYSSASQVVRQILEGPVTRPALLRWRRRQFFSEAGFSSYFGVFNDFAQTRDWLPPNPEFDHAASAAEYVNVRTKKVFAYDYPVMWWLERTFRDGATRVLDIGGSVGVHFYAYQRYFEMPNELSWQVVEAPAIASIGREMARQAEASALSFAHTDAFEQELPGNDIWLSAGALHYLDDARPAELLKQCETCPRHILLNKLPLYDGEDYVTAQNIGAGCFAPMHVYNRQRLINEVEALGYALRDEWQVPERSLYLPGFPKRCVQAYSGLYFATRATCAEVVPCSDSGMTAVHGLTQPWCPCNERRPIPPPLIGRVRIVSCRFGALCVRDRPLGSRELGEHHVRGLFDRRGDLHRHRVLAAPQTSRQDRKCFSRCAAHSKVPPASE